MDVNALSQIIRQFQESNQQFITQILAQNKAVMEDVVSKNQTAPSIPLFGNFNTDLDKWSTYHFQMEHYFKANSISCDDTKRSCFLSWVGADILELLQKLFEGKAEEKSYKELVSALNEHFLKKQHILAARFKFYNQMRKKANQSYAEWVAELRGAARECSFICSNENCRESYVDNKIRDMLVLYTPHEKVRSACLQKSNPSLDEVLQICSIFEATVNASNEIECNTELTTDVNAILLSRLWQISCFHFKNKTKCNKCHKLGHIAKVCQSQANTSQKECFPDQSNTRQNVRQVLETSFEENSISQIEEIETSSVNSVLELHAPLLD
ncbi:uncharacterized protein LOC111689674 [Lucilia cuprina]|uniref:uncharacterized protein LOC111689674 n=1 Tax=Lucilia cuprina TaxID=7375 RepID=UPI001F05CB4D|nr:uncharacterized protein LOC111689674 [Lucilia cuprina]